MQQKKRNKKNAAKKAPAIARAFFIRSIAYFLLTFLRRTPHLSFISSSIFLFS